MEPITIGIGITVLAIISALSNSSCGDENHKVKKGKDGGPDSPEKDASADVYIPSPDANDQTDAGDASVIVRDSGDDGDAGDVGQFDDAGSDAGLDAGSDAGVVEDGGIVSDGGDGNVASDGGDAGMPDGGVVTRE